MSEYDIRGAVRDALAAGYSADPNLIADKLVGEIPGRELRAVLADVLPTFVSTRLGLYRQSLLTPSPEREPGVPRKSAVVSLLAPVRAVDGWHFLKDCTVEDVLRLVEERRDRADRLNARADQYQHLADLMVKRKARVVGDLSEKDLTAVFG